ncbi:MAG: sensor of ECF-type sigma factor [Flavobacterium sp.]|uniref:sensor of ECF-type sigma factor n=1 Tax=unclassified Flavobacterium TaxID=196869 RepID=UPI000C4F1DF0|nr:MULTISPECIES: sensor of ECF-type sigma factor [unclassified Flavobacterium]MBF02230.1 sensor of ECF-type sigma factor [Flavobacterium sp.]MCO6163239.1 sensor of ECF-type sigma factor [Flavobacterium sp. NRK F7]
MRKKLTLLLILIVSVSFAQGGMKEKKEKIKALKVAYITEKLDLTTEEAQKFWPVYNTFDDKQFEIRHNKMKSIVNQFENGGFESLSDKEALDLITKMEDYEDEMHALKKKYLKDLLKVLPPKKVIRLKKAEDEFNRKLLREFRGRKN